MPPAGCQNEQMQETWPTYTYTPGAIPKESTKSTEVVVSLITILKLTGAILTPSQTTLGFH